MSEGKPYGWNEGRRRALSGYEKRFALKVDDVRIARAVLRRT